MALDAHDNSFMSVNGFPINLLGKERKPPPKKYIYQMIISYNHTIQFLTSECRKIIQLLILEPMHNIKR